MFHIKKFVLSVKAIFFLFFLKEYTVGVMYAE